MAIHIVDHPLVRHKVGLLREKDISTKDFRALASEISRLLTYEPTKDIPTEAKAIETWAGPADIASIMGKKITFILILRAGLGMMDGYFDLIPSAKVSIVGFCRDESTLQPIQYYVKLAKNIVQRTALILDPMLTTGGTYSRHTCFCW
ncbi:MAG: uracil phosphoribosyltransferase [Desulfocapsa sp.]|nr:uracil phosphoribosyltransferase [Desulfocapsa sp.]